MAETTEVTLLQKRSIAVRSLGLPYDWGRLLPRSSGNSCRLTGARLCLFTMLLPKIFFPGDDVASRKGQIRAAVLEALTMNFEFRIPNCFLPK